MQWCDHVMGISSCCKPLEQSQPGGRSSTPAVGQLLEFCGALWQVQQFDMSEKLGDRQLSALWCALTGSCCVNSRGT